MTTVEVRRAVDTDRPAIEAFLYDRGMRPVARLGEAYDPAGDPAFPKGFAAQLAYPFKQ